MTSSNLRDKLILLQSYMDIVAKVIVFVLYISIIIVVFTSVLSRYILDVPHNHADQLSKYLLIWFIFIAAGLAAKEGSHIAIDVFVRKFNARAQAYLSIIISICVSVFFILVIVSGYQMVLSSVDYRDPLVWNVNLAFIYASVPVGFLYLLIQFNLTVAIDLLDSSSNKLDLDKSADVYS